jgi:hypothetical protein
MNHQLPQALWDQVRVTESQQRHDIVGFFHLSFLVFEVSHSEYRQARRAEWPCAPESDSWDMS